MTIYFNRDKSVNEYFYIKKYNKIYKKLQILSIEIAYIYVRAV